MMSSMWALQARLSFGNLGREKSSVLNCSGSCHSRRRLCSARVAILSAWRLENPFGTEPSRPDIVRFVSILSRAGAGPATFQFTFPPDGEWLVRVIASNKRFVFGVYRRHMKTIGYLGRIDKLFGVPATTRNWNTILGVLRILKDGEKKAAGVRLLDLPG